MVSPVTLVLVLVTLARALVTVLAVGAVLKRRLSKSVVVLVVRVVLCSLVWNVL